LEEGYCNQDNGQGKDLNGNEENTASNWKATEASGFSNSIVGACAQTAAAWA